MGTLSTVILGDRAWLWPVVGMLLVAAAIVAAGYVRAGWPLGRKAAAALLKIVGIGLVLLCLTEPLWSGNRVKPGENRFVLLVDDSASLQIADERGGPTRGDELHELLARDPTHDWQDSLEREFDVRRYTFSTRLQAAEQFKDASFEGTSSRLYSAADMLRERFRDRPVAGVLLFSDGNATDREPAGSDWSDLPPIYPVLWSESADQFDVAVENVTVNQSSFEDAPVTVQANVRVTGDAGDEDVVGQLVKEDGTVIQEVRAAPARSGAPVALKFEVRTAATGVEFYRVRAALAGHVAHFDDPSEATEAVLANNSQLVAVERDPEPHRILYVSGRPNWEFKFLRRSVEADEALQLVGLVRIAKKEAKFEFRARGDDRSNPLFQGFDADRETETENYDEPVIVRIGTRDEEELRNGFPRTPEELYEYHAVILDDVEAAFFSHDQLSLLEKYVSDRGGSLLMLGGPDSFAHGRYGRTIVEDMLPFYLSGSRRVNPMLGEYRWKLTRDGWLQPWARLRRTEAEEEQRIASMPAFRTLSPADVVKPGARTLAEVRDALGNDYPALIAQQYGEGRTAAMLVGDAWRWPLQRSASVEEPDDYARAWRQLLRWLVVDVPPRIDVDAEQGSASANIVRLVARVRDPAFEPVETAGVQFTIVDPDGSEHRVMAEPSLEEPGLFTAEYAPRDAGGYRATAVVTDEAGDETGRVETGWSSDPSADEFRRISVDRAALETLAAATGGEVVSRENLSEFVESLPSRKAPVMESWSTPLWHSPWILLIAIGCLAGEWGLRRWRGLP